MTNGSLAPGRLLDILAVRGDPLARVGVLRNVRIVSKGREWVK